MKKNWEGSHWSYLPRRRQVGFHILREICRRARTRQPCCGCKEFAFPSIFFPSLGRQLGYLLHVHVFVQTRRSHTTYISTLSIALASSFSELNSPRDIIFMMVLVAWPTAREVFFAAPATTGCREMIGRLALSWIIAGYQIIDTKSSVL